MTQVARGEALGGVFVLTGAHSSISVQLHVASALHFFRHMWMNVSSMGRLSPQMMLGAAHTGGAHDTTAVCIRDSELVRMSKVRSRRSGSWQYPSMDHKVHSLNIDWYLLAASGCMPAHTSMTAPLT